MGTFGCIALFVVVLITTTIFSGYALSILWEWFFVPLLGAPKLSIPGAIGIALVVQYLTHQSISQNNGKSFKEVMLEAAGYAIAKPLVSLFLGLIIVQWI